MHPIIAGPSKFDLSHSFFSPLARDGKAVTFTIKLPYGDRAIRVLIDGISAEDGSGESWNMVGFALLKVGDVFVGKKITHERNRVKIYFRTSNRKGHIVFQ